MHENEPKDVQKTLKQSLKLVGSLKAQKTHMWQVTTIKIGINFNEKQCISIWN